MVYSFRLESIEVFFFFHLSGLFQTKNTVQKVKNGFLSVRHNFLYSVAKMTVANKFVRLTVLFIILETVLASPHQ